MCFRNAFLIPKIEMFHKHIGFEENVAVVYPISHPFFRLFAFFFIFLNQMCRFVTILLAVDSTSKRANDIICVSLHHYLSRLC